MALGRRGGRFETNIWPGFVDAMTGLVLVIMFVLTIVMVVQGVMRDQLSTQDRRLGELGDQVAQLGQALGTAQGERDAAEAARAQAAGEALALSRDLALRSEDLAGARARVTDAEAQIATLIAARAADKAAAEAREQQLTARSTAAEGRASAAELAVASARAEIDDKTAAARLDAARAEALEALIADLRAKGNASTTALDEARTKLSEAEAARLTDAAAAEALRAKLGQSQAEMSAMSLALEESRKRAEDTLTLLAAADAAKEDARAEGLSEAQRQAALLKIANDKLAGQEALSAEGARKVAALNAQVAALNRQLAQLQGVLQSGGEAQAAAELKVADLGRQLNAALLNAAEGEKAKAALQAERAAKADAEAKLAAERAATAEAKAQDLTRYRSEFFGRLSAILAGRQGVKVVGDRFVFSSDVVFPAAEATLSAEGRAQIAQVTAQLKEIAAEIPPEVDWILRVDGHTDNTPLSGQGQFADNWALSQARALAVVRYMVDDLGFPPDRLAAAGFGEFRPAEPGDTPEARAANRRIELKLTER
ncbi:peptidoglycan -binding protein [Paracoccus suum]|uniref:Peptidoglycan -binding protein n=1 Tax=Paracoccus suum TaxID=2259340 RepID=A0A344PLS0_9RHOB|nr:peptidoglycan -binding protein [Paracoccus suum]AXC50325.1 peptidoglycan -binding protein [Paracoccus suum]